MNNFPFFFKAIQVFEGFEVVFVVLVPPVKLQKIDSVRVHALQSKIDGCFDDLAGDYGATTLGHPLGKALQILQNIFAPFPHQLPPKFADEVRRWPIVLCEIPSGETGIVVGKHAFDRRFWIDGSVVAAHLPKTIQDAADALILSELELARFRQTHKFTDGILVDPSLSA